MNQTLNEAEKKKVFLYGRVSTDMQQKGKLKKM